MNVIFIVFCFVLSSQALSMQQQVARAFIKNFQLTSSELTVLHGSARESPVTEEFFSTINKVQVAHLSVTLL